MRCPYVILGTRQFRQTNRTRLPAPYGTFHHHRKPFFVWILVERYLGIKSCVSRAVANGLNKHIAV